MSSAAAGSGADPDPDAIVAAVLACPAVAAMSGGVAGEVATYLPGRRVGGVRIDAATVTVHVIGRYGPAMAEIGGEVRRSVTPLAAGRQVQVVIDDLELPAAGAGEIPGVPSAPLPDILRTPPAAVPGTAEPTPGTVTIR